MIQIDGNSIADVATSHEQLEKFWNEAREFYVDTVHEVTEWKDLKVGMRIVCSTTIERILRELLPKHATDRADRAEERVKELEQRQAKDDRIIQRGLDLITATDERMYQAEERADRAEKRVRELNDARAQAALNELAAGKVQSDLKAALQIQLDTEQRNLSAASERADRSCERADRAEKRVSMLEQDVKQLEQAVNQLEQDCAVSSKRADEAEQRVRVLEQERSGMLDEPRTNFGDALARAVPLPSIPKDWHGEAQANARAEEAEKKLQELVAAVELALPDMGNDEQREADIARLRGRLARPELIAALREVRAVDITAAKKLLDE